MAMKSLTKDYKLFFTDRLWRSFFTAWSLRNFAFGLIAVYSPIYFYQKGYGLGFIFLYLAIQALCNGLMRLPYAYYLSKRKKDVRLPFAFSMIMLAIVYGLYALFINSKSALLVIGGIDGVLQCALWSSYHYVFTAAQHHKKIGSQVGLMYDGSYMSAVIAIALGGFIGQHFGLGYNFIVAAAVLAIATLAILHAKIIWPHRSRSVKQQKVNFAHVWRDSVAGSANVIDASVVAILWPLLFVVLGILDYIQVGFVVAVGLFIAIVMNLLFGKIANDVDDARSLLDGGIMGTILIYMLRVISMGNTLGMIILHISAQVVRGAVDVSYSVLFYRRLKKADSKIKYIATYESLTGYALAGYFMVLWAVHQFGMTDKLTLILAFVIAAAIAPLVRLIAPDNFRELR